MSTSIGRLRLKHVRVTADEADELVAVACTDAEWSDLRSYLAALLDVAEAAQELLSEWILDGHESVTDDEGNETHWCRDCWVEAPCPTVRWRDALVKLNGLLPQE